MLAGPGYRAAGHGLWLGELRSHHYAIACEESRAGFLAPGIDDTVRRSAGGPDHEPEHYFDPTRPMPTSDSCGD
ncbi:hypothetical protein SUDANB95_05541 [Actinosynnema sp. ALI-1.44]